MTHRRVRRSILDAAKARKQASQSQSIEQRIRIRGLAIQAIQALQGLEQELKAAGADSYTLKDIRRLQTSVQRIQERYSIKER